LDRDADDEYPLRTPQLNAVALVEFQNVGGYLKILKSKVERRPAVG
jgi:hypothetical protein